MKIPFFTKYKAHAKTNGEGADIAESLCYAPSVNMLFGTDGTVRACCHNNENILGRYPEKSIKDIWNSEEAKRFRQEMANQNFLSGCQGCARDYASGNIDQMPARHFKQLPRHHEYPTMMEFLLTNTCNLECAMCTGELSSLIRKNRDKLPAINSPYGDEFVDQLQEFIPHLVETRFSGAGEAFAIDLNYKFWEMLIANNPACKIVVQTNGTILNAKVRDFLDRGNFNIGISIDSLEKEKFETIRLNASFDQVMKNTQYFSDYSSKHNRNFTISCCVMRNNWMEMPAIVEFCNRMGAYVTFHKVWSPMKYAINRLSAQELENIYTTLSRYECSSNNTLEKGNKKHYEYYLSVIKQWMIEAQHGKLAAEDLVMLSYSELSELAKERLKTYISGQRMLEVDKEELIRQCEDKIDGVIQLWGEKIGKANMLIKLCLAKESDMVGAMKTQSIEKLYEMSVATADS